MSESVSQSVVGRKIFFFFSTGERATDRLAADGCGGRTKKTKKKQKKNRKKTEKKQKKNRKKTEKKQKKNRKKTEKKQKRTKPTASESVSEGVREQLRQRVRAFVSE